MNTKIEVRINAPADLSKEWYVYLYADNKIQKKFYKGLKKLTSYEDRMLEAISIKKFLENELKKGYNPVSNLPNIESVHYYFLEGYELAINEILKNNLSRTTVSQYKTHLKQITKTIKYLKYENESIKDFEPYHISIILSECQKIFKGTNDFYNKHLKCSKRIFKELCKMFILNNNPALTLENKSHQTKEKQLLTNEQYDVVINHMDKFCPAFLTFIYCVELGIRPNEARQLKVGMIQNDFIHLPKEITKTKKNRVVPITEKLKGRFIELKKYPDDFYVFGIAYKNARDVKNKFIPSATMMGINSANNFWREQVKETLDINSDLYWLKSKNANDLRKSGIDISIIKDLYGHSHESITRIYATEDYNIRMKEVANELKKLKSK